MSLVIRDKALIAAIKSQANGHIKEFLWRAVRAVQLQAINYDTLDPGIRDVVKLLRENGFETTDSGDGVTKPPEGRTFDVPHVICQTTPEFMLCEGARLKFFLPRWRIEMSYAIGEPAFLIATKP